MPLPWPKPWPVMVIALLPGTVQASTFWRGSAPDASVADAGRAGSSSALAASAIGSRRERVMWSLPRERTTNL